MLKPIAKFKDYLKHHPYFDEEPDGSEILSVQVRPRFNWGIFLSIVFFVLLILRLFFLQVQEGFVNYKLAEGNRLRDMPIPAPRGLILSDKNEPLVENEPVYQLLVQAGKIKKIPSLDSKIFEFIGMTGDEVVNKIKSEPGVELVVLKDNVPRDDALLLKSRLASYEEFEVAQAYSRKYPDPSLSHVIGYLGKVSEDEAKNKSILLINKFTGKSGLESEYDDYLQGQPGYRRAEVDASGKIMRIVSSVDPEPGRDIKTSIDRELQLYSAQKLQEKTDEFNTKGTVIVMNPKDGSIKALVSVPFYDNNALSAGLSKEDYEKLINDPNKPLFNRAISGVYPPGSSIKPFIATAGLSAGVVSVDLAFDTPPEIEVGQWKFPDWKDHGTTDIRRAIAESNNIFFFAVGGGWGPIKNGLGPDGIKNGLEKFGFGDKTGVDLPGESSGFIPTPEWKKRKMKESWYIGNTYNMSIGQGDLLVTPLELANATAAIANGGKLFRPHFALEISANESEPAMAFNESNTLVNSSIFPSKDLDVVREGMRMTVTEGSARSIFWEGFPVDVAAKTGTAQFGNEDKTHAWFTSYAPYDDPQIVVTVLVEGAGEGYQVAAPIASEIYQWWAANRK